MDVALWVGGVGLNEYLCVGEGIGHLMVLIIIQTEITSLRNVVFLSLQMLTQGQETSMHRHKEAGCQVCLVDCLHLNGL